MWYKATASIPSGTTAADPDKQSLKISKGELTHWLFVNPAECADLMKFKIFYHNHQLFPYSRDEWADALIAPEPLEDSFKISVPPYVIDIHAYNVDDTYSHEYNIYVNIIPDKPRQIEQPGFDLKGAWDRLFGGGG